MDRDNLVKECDRLLNLLGELDPESDAYKTISERLIGSGGKGGCKGLYDALLAMDNSAQDLLDKERQMEIEFKKIEIEEIKIKLEQTKFESQKDTEEARIANEARRLDIEEEHYKNEQQEAERRLDIEELKANTEAEEVKQRQHYTRGQCAWRLVEIGAETLGIAALIKYTGKVQEFGILDKNLLGFIPKTKKF